MNEIFSKKLDGFPEDSFVNKCLLCGKKVDIASAKIMEKKQGDPAFLFLTCSECKGSVILAMASDIFGTVSFAMVTDMTFEDAKRFRDQEDLSYDAILDIYISSKNKERVAEKAGKN